MKTTDLVYLFLNTNDQALYRYAHFAKLYMTYTSTPMRLQDRNTVSSVFTHIFT